MVVLHEIINYTTHNSLS